MSAGLPLNFPGEGIHSLRATVKPAEPAPIDLSPAVQKAGEPAKEDVRGTDKEKDKETEAPAKKRGFWSRIFRGSSGK